MIYFIIILLLLLVVYVIKSYNNLIKMNEMVDNSMAQIAAQVESRWDALRNLIDTTKHYSEYELDAFDKITKNRTGINRNSSVSDVDKDDKEFNRAVTSVNAVSENYPELKSSDLYKETMTSINRYEDNVRHSRMIYNDTVTKFNRTIKSFPQSLFSSALGFSDKEYFKNSEEKSDIPSFND